jgi:hypothetical protein
MLETVATLHHLDHAAPDQLGRQQRRDVVARELDRALGDLAALDPEQVGDRFQRGGLAGAVGAQERDHAAFGHAQRDAAQHQDDAVVDDLDVVDDQQRPGRLRPGPQGRLGWRGRAHDRSTCRAQLEQLRGVIPFSLA